MTNSLWHMSEFWLFVILLLTNRTRRGSERDTEKLNILGKSPFGLFDSAAHPLASRGTEMSRDTQNIGVRSSTTRAAQPEPQILGVWCRWPDMNAVLPNKAMTTIFRIIHLKRWASAWRNGHPQKGNTWIGLTSSHPWKRASTCIHKRHGMWEVVHPDEMGIHKKTACGKLEQHRRQRQRQQRQRQQKVGKSKNRALASAVETRPVLTRERAHDQCHSRTTEDKFYCLRSFLFRPRSLVPCSLSLTPSRCCLE